VEKQKVRNKEMTLGLEQWEEAWSDYIFALEMWDTGVEGEDTIYWAGVAGRRLFDAKCQLREIDPTFCQSLGI
jgi:hypothetical protein